MGAMPSRAAQRVGMLAPQHVHALHLLLCVVARYVARVVTGENMAPIILDVTDYEISGRRYYLRSAMPR